jgi:peptidoglycan/xylan/chitin deacetylase (PgdA/CDA1 family)
MNLTKKLLLATYRGVTRPYRWQWRRRAVRTGDVPISILFYHRVAEDLNPWTISHADFIRQIDWLQNRFQLISLEEAQRRLWSSVSFAPAVSITFDDGYADNSLRAIPLLLERNIPFTYFVAWRYIRDQIPFPHDTARGKPLAPNSIASIRALAEMGVEIGSHTMTHADIGRLTDPAERRNEIVESKVEIEQTIGRPVRYFAFPYGQHANLNQAAFVLGRQAGYVGMCSAYGGYNYPGMNGFHLQRFHGDPHLTYLKNWLDFDPRSRRIRPFALGAADADSTPIDAAANPDSENGHSP